MRELKKKCKNIMKQNNYKSRLRICNNNKNNNKKNCNSYKNQKENLNI